MHVGVGAFMKKLLLVYVVPCVKVRCSAHTQLHVWCMVQVENECAPVVAVVCVCVCAFVCLCWCSVYLWCSVCVSVLGAVRVSERVGG